MKSFTIFCLIILLCSISLAQDGTLDTGFGSGGIVITPNGYANCVKIQTNGKIIIGGTDSNDIVTTVRYNKDGTTDSLFGSNGIVKTYLSIDGSRIYASSLMHEDKILLAGVTDIYTNNPLSVLVRYDSIGNLDNTFGNNGVVLHDVTSESEYISKIIVQPDEKILVSGYTLSKGFIFRCQSNGDIDNTFGINGNIFPDPFFFISSMLLQVDGKFVITGNSISIPSTQIAVARFNSDGSPDSSFGADGIVLTSIGTHLQSINSLALQDDGKIILAGEHLGINGETLEDVLVRYNIDGSLDNEFGVGGIVRFIPYGEFNYMVNMGLLDNGKILMSGCAILDAIGSFRSGMFLMRFIQNGNIDSTFGNQGFFITPPDLELITGREFAIQNDNKIILTGNSNGNFATARINLSSIDVVIRTPVIKSPNNFFLGYNYPNPFNSNTNIQYVVSSRQFVTLKVYDVLGNEVAVLVNEEKPAGSYDVAFDASKLASGVYYYQIKAGEFIETKKMILLK